MTILDLEEQREARRRADWERWEARNECELWEIRRAVDALTPLVNQLIAEGRFRRRGPPCESPGCGNSFTGCEPATGPNPAIVRLCATHQQAVRCGRLRVSADGPDVLVWEVYDRTGALPRSRLKWPRGGRRRRSGW